MHALLIRKFIVKQITSNLFQSNNPLKNLSYLLLFMLTPPLKVESFCQNVTIGVYSYRFWGIQHRDTMDLNLNLEYDQMYNLDLCSLWGGWHIGTHLDFYGGTSQFYTGFVVRIPYEKVFILISLGGEIHNSTLKERRGHKDPLSSRILFRESIGFGITFATQQSISLMLDHASNARIVKPNKGISGVSVRYTYTL
jgi:hypothetical protein